MSDVVEMLKREGFRFIGYLDGDRIFLDPRTWRNVSERQALQRVRVRLETRGAQEQGGAR